MPKPKRVLIAVAAASVGIAAVFVFANRCHAEAAQGEGEYVQTTLNALGTFVTIRAFAENRPSTEEAVEAATALVRDLEKPLSRFDEESDVSAVNKAAAGTAVSVSDDTLHVLLKAAQVSEKTSGAIDVTVGPLVDLWKAAGESGTLPTDDAIREALSKVSCKHLTIDSEAHTVTKAVDGLTIDLGAVAKGYIADKAAALLQSRGVKRGFVDAGGDGVFFSGGAAERPWKVGIADPRGTGEVVDALFLRDAAAVTSGNYARFSTIEGKRYSHIIDPRTGRPVEGPDSVTVIAADAATADAWATALSVTGETGADAARAAGVEFLMLFVEDDTLSRFESPGFAQYRKE